jgi:hypothetical protein
MPLISLCQNDFDSEQYKYWYYRERLKWFVMPGNSPGQSFVAAARNMSVDNSLNDKSLKYTQPHTVNGYYIGVLATEYRLLRDNNQQSEALSTLSELNLALDALLRTDLCEDGIPWHNPFGVEDGFFNREDVPAVLPQSMEDYFNQGLSADNTFYQQVDTGFRGLPYFIDKTAIDCNLQLEDQQNYFGHNILANPQSTWYGYQTNNAIYWEYWRRQKFISQDELIGTLVGLSLVTTLVDDEPTVEKAAWLAGNMVSFARINPNCTSLPWRLRFPDCERIVDNDGGNLLASAYGLLRAAQNITGQYINYFPAISHALDFVPFTISLKDVYKNAIELLILGNAGNSDVRRARVLMSELIAVSDATGRQSRTPHGALKALGDEYNWEPFYMLLWAVVNNKDLSKNKYDYSYNKLIDQLTSAPCGGPYHYVLPSGMHLLKPGWGGYLKYQLSFDQQTYGENNTTGNYSGLDYMLLYNLACLAFPDGFEYNNQTYRFPYYVNLNDRHDVFTHYPYTYVYSAQGAHMNNFGSVTHPEEIRAISTIESHIIVSNTTEIIYSKPQYENENLNFDEAGDVTLKAGESIKLTDGFRVDAGAHFLARIESYSCGGLSYKNMAAPPWSENYRGSYYDTLISVPMEKRAPIVYSEDNYEDEEFDMSLWEDYYYMYDTTAVTELAVGAWLNPNPCGSSATLTVVSENEQQLTIELYDMTGIKRETVFNDIADQNLVLDLNLSTYASGTYMLRITGSGGMKVMRFVKE